MRGRGRGLHACSLGCSLLRKGRLACAQYCRLDARISALYRHAVGSCATLRSPRVPRWVVLLFVLDARGLPYVKFYMDPDDELTAASMDDGHFRVADEASEVYVVSWSGKIHVGIKRWYPQRRYLLLQCPF